MYLVRIWGGGFLAPPITTRIHVTCVCMGGSGIKLVYFSMGGYTTFWYHPYPWGGVILPLFVKVSKTPF